VIRKSTPEGRRALAVWPTKKLGGQVRDARCAQQKQHCCNAQNELYRSHQRESNIFSEIRIFYPRENVRGCSLFAPTLPTNN
jgi:hypothetical protein